jgi:hypothetical protein
MQLNLDKMRPLTVEHCDSSQFLEARLVLDQTVVRSVIIFSGYQRNEQMSSSGKDTDRKRGIAPVLGSRGPGLLCTVGIRGTSPPIQQSK